MKCSNPDCRKFLDPGYNGFVIDVDDYQITKGFECPACGDEYQIRYERVGLMNITRGEEL